MKYHLNLLKQENWYEETIEPEIREIVFLLRNAGINTRGSCGHKMWVYCDWIDVDDASRATNVLQKAGYVCFQVNSCHYVGADGIPHSSIRIEFYADGDINAPVMVGKARAKGDATERWRAIDRRKCAEVA